MSKTLILSCALLWCTLWRMQAKEFRIFLGLGCAYHTYQDTRFSDHQFTKLSLQPELGFTLLSGKNFYSAFITAYAYRDVHPAMENTDYVMKQADLRFNYLREIASRFSLGVSWDVLDYTIFNQPDLGNSSDGFILSSDFLVASNYRLAINDKWKIAVGLDVGALSFMKMAPSFTANFEEKLVDDGEVRLQEPNSCKPFRIRNINTKPFWEQMYFRTNIEVSYKKRIGLAYNWRARSVWKQKEYPVIQANHNVSFRFYFVSHVKIANP